MSCIRNSQLCWAEAIALKLMFDKENSTWLSSTCESASATGLFSAISEANVGSKLYFKVQMTNLSRRRPFRLRTHKKCERIVVSI